MKKTRMDTFFLAGLLILGLLLAGSVYLPRVENGSVVEVRVRGKVTATYPLSSNIEKTITTEDGDSNTFCIKDHKVTMKTASCPDQICVHQGFISTSLLPITCLPNRLVIRVREEVSVPDDTAPVPDGVTY